MPGEFSQLKDLECYVKLPGDYPCTKLQTKYQKPPALRQEPFLLKPEKARTYGTLPSTTSTATSVSISNAVSQSGEIPCM
jgi:type IV secretory pathway TraG/TraD family ATPase VirD4